MVIEESVLINAQLTKVWEIITNLSCWKDWNTVLSNVSSENDLLQEGTSFQFCMRPFNIPLNIKPHVEEIVIGHRIIWSGRKHGVHVQHEFTFQEKDNMTLLKSREVFSGLVMILVKYIFPASKLRELTSLMLLEIKKAAESNNE